MLLRWMRVFFVPLAPLLRFRSLALTRSNASSTCQVVQTLTTRLASTLASLSFYGCHAGDVGNLALCCSATADGPGVAQSSAGGPWVRMTSWLTNLTWLQRLSLRCKPIEIAVMEVLLLEEGAGTA